MCVFPYLAAVSTALAKVHMYARIGATPRKADLVSPFLALVELHICMWGAALSPAGGDRRTDPTNVLPAVGSYHDRSSASSEQRLQQPLTTTATYKHRDKQVPE